MAKKPDDGPKRYVTRLEAARKWRRENFDSTWRKMIELYRGKQHLNTGSYEDVATINIAKSTIDIIFSSTTVRNPKLNVFPRTPEGADTAQTVEAVINYWWNFYGVQDEFRAAFKDCLTLGHGWLKTTYRFEEATEPVSDDEIEHRFVQANEQVNDAAMEMPDMAAEMPTEDELRKLISQDADANPNTVVLEDRPVVVRVSPFDVFVDPEATSMRDARWIAQRVVRSYDNVREDERYDPKTRKDIKASAVATALTEEDDRGVRRATDDEAKRVVLWEFYDLENDKFCVFADGAQDYLVAPRAFPFPFGHPFVQMRNYDVPGDFYPLGEIEPIANLQEELNETRTQLLNHRKRYARKYLAQRHVLGSEAQAALRSRKDGEIVFVDDAQVPLSEVIQPLPQIPISGDLYNMTQMIHSDIERVSGVNEYMRGAAQQIRRTATEAAILQDAAAARAADKLEIVEKTAAEVGRRMIELAQELLTTEQVARIVGPDGSMSWVRFEREDIAGQYDFTVETGSTLPRSDATQRQDAMQMLQIMGPFVGQFVDGAELVKMVLRKFGEPQPEKYMVQQQPAPAALPPGMPPAAPGGPAGVPADGALPPMPADIAQLLAQDPSLSGVAGAPQAMNMQGAFDGSIGNALSPEMLAQLQNQVGLR